MRVFSPYDPADRLRRGCTGAPARSRARPRTGSSRWAARSACRSNGAVSNLAPTPYALTTLRKELRAAARRRPRARAGRADRRLGRARLARSRRSSAPSTATRRTRSRTASPTASSACGASSNASRPHRRVRGRRVDRRSASTAAATAIIPNGVDLPRAIRRERPRATAEPLRIAFVGQAVERKGLPVLLRAFEALREHVPRRARRSSAPARRRSRRCCSTRPASACSARSATSASTPRSTSADLLVRAVARRRELRHGADRGASRPARRSSRRDIAGYRDVVARRRGRRPRARAATRPRWPRRCATSRSTPTRRAAHGRQAAASARALRLADGGRGGPRRPTRTRSRCPRPRRPRADRASCLGSTRRRRAAAASARSACRASSPRRPRRARPARRLARRAAIARRRGRRRRAVRGSPCSGSALDQIGQSARRRHARGGSLVALGLMCLSMAVRAVAWHAILRAALPQAPLRPADALAGHVHRRAHVRDAARPARRAVARADRRAADSAARARPADGRAGHDRVPDAAQRRSRSCCSGS